MSSYRDDTQETMVIADSVFTKVKTDVVENLKIIDKEIARIKVLMLDSFAISDEVSSTKIGLFVDEANIADEVFSKLTAKHLISETLRISDSTRSTFKVVNPTEEHILIQDIVQHRVIALANDIVTINDGVSTRLTAKTDVYEKLKITDSIVSNNHVLDMVSDTVSISEKFNFKLRSSLTDSININDSVQHNLYAKISITDRLKIKDILANIYHDFVLDFVGIVDSVPTKPKYKDQITEQILVSSELLERRRVYESINEMANAVGALSGKLKATQRFDDLMFIEDVIPTELFLGSAWTSGCDVWNMSRYGDFNYTQLAIINGELFAVCDTGVHQLVEGAQDVSAKITTPKLDIGDGSLVHPLGAYLEYELSGNSRKLEVGVVTTQSGTKQAYYYLLPIEKADELTNGRVLFGRGLRGRHFAFEIKISGQHGYINDLSIDVSATKRRV